MEYLKLAMPVHVLVMIKSNLLRPLNTTIDLDVPFSLHTIHPDGHNKSAIPWVATDICVDDLLYYIRMFNADSNCFRGIDLGI